MRSTRTRRRLLAAIGGAALMPRAFAQPARQKVVGLMTAGSGAKYLSPAAKLGRIATLADKVLRGTPAGTIPFELPDKTQFSFNRATARAMGLRVPDDILVRATEVFG